MWPWNRELPKWKSRDNNLPKLHPSQFDFHHNTLLSLALIWNLGSLSWPTHLTSFLTHLIFHLTHLTPYRLRHIGKASMYKPEGYSAWVSADCPLVETWGWIILGRHLVARSDRSAGHSQISSLMQSSALLSVLVKVYWLDDKGLTTVKPG